MAGTKRRKDVSGLGECHLQIRKDIDMLMRVRVLMRKEGYEACGRGAEDFRRRTKSGMDSWGFRHRLHELQVRRWPAKYQGLNAGECQIRRDILTIKT